MERTVDELMALAWALGRDHGIAHPGREYPLSGEWAGESATELLFGPLGWDGDDERYLLEADLLDEFEAGYWSVQHGG